MNYLQMLIKPIMTMWGNIQLLVPASVVGIGLTLLNTVIDLVQVEFALVLGLILLIFIDLVSGVYKALTRGNLVTSMGLRQTTIKLLEYTLAITGFVVLANMADAEWIKKTAFVWLGFIEVKSIIENLTDKKGVINELYKTIRDKFTSTES